jgi:FkbM family methyltransferase
MIDLNKLLFRDISNDENVFNNVFKINEYNLPELSKDSVIVDIGAHIGSFSLKAFEMGSRNIYSFEANTHNSVICKYNCEPYNIKVFNKAVRGDERISSVCSRLAKSDSEKSINYGGLAINFGEGIEVITLKDILEIVGGHIDILKLDCEGSEYPIIFESNKDVFNNIKNIVGEFHPRTLPVNFCEGFVNNPNNLEEYLKQQNYETKFIATKGGFGHFFCEK